MLGSFSAMTAFQLALPVPSTAFEMDLVDGESPRPLVFPASEPPGEKVSESKRHLENRTLLYLLLKEHLASTCALGSEQFVYYDAQNPRRCLSPDLFVKRDFPDDLFDVWKTWERKAPELGVEIVSEFDRRDGEWQQRFGRYQDAGFQEVVRFDEANTAAKIRVWDRMDGKLVERAQTDPKLRFCKTLGWWWVVIARSANHSMLRLAKDSEGLDLLPTPNDARVLEGVAHQATKQRLLVVDHEKLLAEQGRREAEQRQQEAEQRLRDETAARLHAERELERLRAALAEAQKGR